MSDDTSRRDRLPDVRGALASRISIALIARVLVTIALLAVPVGILYISWTLVGPLSTILYAFMFLLGFGAIPTLIGIMGGATPFGGKLGRGLMVLGAAAAGHWYLIQDDEGFQLCVGDADRIWYDGGWVDIDGGFEHKTRLAWRPFGLAWIKSDDSLREARVDGQPTADGGEHHVERAGIREVAPPSPTVAQCPSCEAQYPDEQTKCDACGEVLIDVEGGRSSWVVDLKRLYREGLARIGNIELIETTEEQTMRDETTSGATSEWMLLISGTLGLVVGAAAGYVVMFV